MRIESDTGGWRDAASAFRTGNQRAALTSTTLTQALTRSAGMAGDDSTSISFATAYDQAAQTATDTLADLVDAYANLARLTDHSRANHTRADQASTLGTTLGCTTYDGTTAPATGDCLTVTRVDLPTALGENPFRLPHGIAWVLDHVQGFIWPNADTDQLRATATDWTDAAIHLTGLHETTTAAHHHLQAQTSPEIPHAVAATETLEATTVALAAQLRALAHACTEYAGEVERHRHEIIELVEDLLRDAVIIEGIGLFLGVVTAGLTAAGAAAVNAARIAVEAPRIVGILDDLLAVAVVGARMLDVTRVAITPLTTTLTRLKTAHLITAAITLADMAPGPRKPDDPASQGGAKPLIDLQQQEELGGHTIEKHVGKTDDELRDRYQDEPWISGSSSFPDLGSANRAVSEAIRRLGPQIRVWMGTSAPKERFPLDLGQLTGRTLLPNGDVKDVTGVLVVLKKDPRTTSGYRITTAYPTP